MEKMNGAFTSGIRLSLLSSVELLYSLNSFIIDEFTMLFLSLKLL